MYVQFGDFTHKLRYIDSSVQHGCTAAKILKSYVNFQIDATSWSSWRNALQHDELWALAVEQLGVRKTC